MLAAYSAIAQTASKIQGSVKDEAGKAIPSVTVSLLKSADSSLVKYSLSDKAGQYEFVNINTGKYFISVSSVGYGKAFSNHFELSDKNVQVPSIALVRNTKDLAGVTVSASRPFIETKVDKTVINVEASPTNAGSTALEVLEKSPGVMVDNDGNISLKGKQGVIVMIDGKPTYLSPTDLAAMLKNMPASALDQIEIMTNPSAKYDAAGNSGIINIKTKKGQAGGFNGSFMVGATTSIYKNGDALYFKPKSQNSFNFNYRKNKINFFGNYNPNFFRGMNILTINSKLIDTYDGSLKGYNDQETHFKFGNFNQTLKLGFDWFANKRNVYGIVVSGFIFNGHPTPTTIADLQDVNHELESRLISYTTNDIHFKNFTGNLNWKHTFDTTGRELTADFDYVRYSNITDMHLTTDIYDGSLTYVGQTELRGHIPSYIDIFSFKSDYTKPFKNGRLEAGIKSSFVNNNNIVNYDVKNGGEWVKDDTRSDHFIYQENINAAYVSVNKQINKWTLQGGLRLENTISKGNQVILKSTFKRDTTNLFPTAFVSYQVDKKNKLTVSYGRRINRPNYQDLNPFIFFLDTLSYRQGNIYLKPQYTNNFELSHALMDKFITTLSYNNTTDVISQIIKPKEGSDGKIRYLTPDNVASLRNMALSLTIPVKPTKWWNISFFSTVYNNHYKGIFDTIRVDQAYTSFMFNLTNTFTISKGFIAEWSGFYRYKNLDGLTLMEPIYQMSFALQKQIIKGKGTLRLNIRDPFAWQKFEGTNKYGYVDVHFLARPDIRQVTANFTYRFGKNTPQSQPRRHVSSAQDEQNRVGGAGQQ